MISSFRRSELCIMLQSYAPLSFYLWRFEMWYRMSLVVPFDLKISADCHENILVNLLVFITSFFIGCEVPYYIFTVVGLTTLLVFI